MSSSNSKGGSSTPTANAWSQPFQQKSRAARLDQIAPPPGMGPSKDDDISDDTAVSNGNGVGIESVLRERFLQLSLSMVGQRVVITRTDGAVIEGIFHTFSPFASQPPHMRNKYVVKSCRLVARGSMDDSDELAQGSFTDGSTVIIRTESVSSVHVKSLRLDTGVSNGNPKVSSGQNEQKIAWSTGSRELLRTDAEISAGKGGPNRDLVAAGSAWTSDVASSGSSRNDKLVGSLDEKSDKGAGRKGFGSSAGVTGNLRGTIGEWDQFKANEDLFDVRASFDENLYTTELDKSQINRTEVQKAERLAKEIEGTSSSNLHISEERGHIVQGDYDEEDKYSGVLTGGGSMKVGVREHGDVDVHDASKKKSATQSSASAKSDQTQTGAPPRIKMNYAAAAAKADAASISKVLPPGIVVETKPVVATSEAETLPTSDVGNETTPKESPPENSEEEKREGGKLSTPPLECSGKESRSPTSGDETKNLNPGIKESDVSVEAKKGENGADTQADSMELEKENPKMSLVDPTADKAKTMLTKDKSDQFVKKKEESKLNAKAKEFTFDPKAKPFTPGAAVGGDMGDPVSRAAESVVESNAMLPSIGAPTPQQIQAQQSHFVQHPPQMGQPGIVPMMNTHFMRYQGAAHNYAGMDQHAPPMQPQQQPQQMQPPPPPGQERVASAPTSGDDPGAQQQQSRASQQQGVPMPYNVPPAGPAAYYGGGMAMHPHPRAAGAHHIGGFHHQLVGGPQQMPVVPGAAPYRHMYGAPTHLQPPSMPQMHVPGGGSPYYQQNQGAAVVSGGVHFTPGAHVGLGPMEDGTEAEYRGGGGRGTTRGGGVRGNRRNGRKNGRGNGGRGSYHGNQNAPHGGASGRHTPQNVSNEVSSTPLSGEGLDSAKGVEVSEVKENGNEAKSGESKGENTPSLVNC